MGSIRERQSDEKLYAKSKMNLDYYLTYEPVFLLDHLEFGSKFRLFKTVSMETLIKQHRPLETSEEMKFVALALHTEEMASYEDLGCLLYAIKERMDEKKTPILATLLTYDNSAAILHKMLAQDNAESFIKNFHMEELLCEDALPAINGINSTKLRKKVGDIFTIDFKKNTKPERVDAYYRMKHGSILMSSATKYAGSKHGRSNFDLPGVLLKTKTLDEHKKKTLPAEIADTPFVPFGFNVGATYRGNTYNAVDVSTRLQQLFCIALLLKYHNGFMQDRGLNRDKLIQKGLEIDKLCIELSSR